MLVDLLEVTPILKVSATQSWQEPELMGYYLAFQVMALY